MGAGSASICVAIAIHSIAIPSLIDDCCLIDVRDGYLILAAIFFVCLVARMQMIFRCGIHGARTIYTELLTKVMYMPTHFFDATTQGPNAAASTLCAVLGGLHFRVAFHMAVGALSARFNSDTEMVDFAVILSHTTGIASYFWLLGAIAAVSESQPFMLAVFVPVIAVFVAIHRYFHKSFVQLQRLGQQAREPIEVR